MLVFGGAGFDLRAVQADGAQLEQLEFAGQFQHVHEGGGDGGEVLATEGADRVGVGMLVGGEVAHGDVTGGGALDAAGVEEAVGLAVDEQRQHHVRRILLVATAFGVGGEGGQREPVHGADDEVDQVVFGDPVAQVWGAGAVGGGAVVVLKAVRHGTTRDGAPTAVFNRAKIFREKSPTDS
jgi:hypothetical protein